MKETLIKNFLRISSIPRMSGHEKQMSDFFVQVAKDNNLDYFQDENYNVLIKKKGNIGGESIALQAHLDMVCVKTSDSNHDFNDGIEVIIDGDKVTAKGTSLGADQGVGLSFMLTLMEEKNLKHPDLEFLFTVEEETTFKGVVTFPYDRVVSKKLINIDYCRDDAVVIGSAGDIVNEYKFKSDLISNDLPAYKVLLDGFKGGNSGEDIEASANNAIVEMARLLEGKEIYISSINGGTFENDLAANCEVVLHTNIDIQEIFKTNVQKVDSNSSFSLVDTRNIINEILSLKGGYLSDITSANLGVINTFENEVTIKYLIRSMDQDELNIISNRTRELDTNFTVNKLYDDPIWYPNERSELFERYKKAYFNIYNVEPKVAIEQGGLECAAIKKRIANLDIISIGARMENFHSTSEITYISSWEKTYNLLVELLNN